MYYAMIRPRETRIIEVAAESLAEVQDQLEAQRPEGFDLTAAPVTMAAGKAALTAVGKYARRDGVSEIEAESMDALRAAVPEGWMMLSVRQG